MPVWVTMPRLPILFFVKPTLFRIASLFRTPLWLDVATLSLKWPGVASIQIEVDLLKDKPHQMWIAMGSAGVATN